MLIKNAHTPGAPPGLEHEEIALLPARSGETQVLLIDYSAAQLHLTEPPPTGLQAALATPAPAGTSVRWVQVTGLADLRAIQQLAGAFHLHPLAVEDVLHFHQRPKAESYPAAADGSSPEQIFLITHALSLTGDALHYGKVCFFLSPGLLLTFSEAPVLAWEAVLERVRAEGSRLRGADASFLMYSLLDALVDCCFPIMEAYGEQAEDLEEQVMEAKTDSSIQQIHRLRRSLLLVRRAVWPMREVIAGLMRDDHAALSEQTRVYLRDLYDHVIQIIDLIENYREMTSDLVETYMSSVSNRMNQVMKVLTIIGTIFMPLSFLSSIYGMNFPDIPELGFPHIYPIFWLVCLLIAAIMLAVFRKRRWL